MAILRRTDEREKETQFWNAVSYWSTSRWCIPQHKFDSDIPLLLGFFTLIFTSVAHFIVKIVSLQEEIQGGLHPSPQTQRPMFQSRRRGGNPHYDYLIRRMQLTDLSGMSVDQAPQPMHRFSIVVI